MYTDLDPDCEFTDLAPLTLQFWGDQSSKSSRIDAAGELFRNIVRMAEGPLNPPILGDFEDMLPQNWGLGASKNPHFGVNISKC